MTDARLACLKANDIRGKVPAELDASLAYQVGVACRRALIVKRVVVGHDIRLSGRLLTEALVRGLQESGAAVLQLGLCGTR